MKTRRFASPAEFGLHVAVALLAREVARLSCARSRSHPDSTREACVREGARLKRAGVADAALVAAVAEALGARAPGPEKIRKHLQGVGILPPRRSRSS